MVYRQDFNFKDKVQRQRTRHSFALARIWKNAFVPKSLFELTKKLFISTNFLSSPTLHKCGRFVATWQILSEADKSSNAPPTKFVPGKTSAKTDKINKIVLILSITCQKSDYDLPGLSSISFSEILFRNSSVIVVDLEPRMVWSWKFPKVGVASTTGWGVSVFYSAQPLKGQLGFEGNWCRKNKHSISSVSSAIWARFRSTKHGTSTRIWTWSIIPPKCSMFWRARQNRVLKGEI